MLFYEGRDSRPHLWSLIKSRIDLTHESSMEALDEGQEISPELREIMERGRKNFEEGRCVCCSTMEELHPHLDSL